jgi:hypothetical protein
MISAPITAKRAAQPRSNQRERVLTAAMVATTNFRQHGSQGVGQEASTHQRGDRVWSAYCVVISGSSPLGALPVDRQLCVT